MNTAVTIGALEVAAPAVGPLLETTRHVIHAVAPDAALNLPSVHEMQALASSGFCSSSTVAISFSARVLGARATRKSCGPEAHAPSTNRFELPSASLGKLAYGVAKQQCGSPLS